MRRWIIAAATLAGLGWALFWWTSPVDPDGLEPARHRPNAPRSEPDSPSRTGAEAFTRPEPSEVAPLTILERYWLMTARWKDGTARRARPLTGRVRDAMSGRALPGVRVRCLEGHLNGMHWSTLCVVGATRFETTTDPDGRFELPVVPGSSVLVAEAPGYGTVRRLLWGEPPPQDIELVPAGTLRGRISTADDTPVPGARVVAALVLGRRVFRSTVLGEVRHSWRHDFRGPRPAVEPVFSCEETTTDRDGRYELDRLAGGQDYEIRVVANGFEDAAPRRRLRLRPGEVRTLDRTLVSTPPPPEPVVARETRAAPRSVPEPEPERPRTRARVRMPLEFPPEHDAPDWIPVRIERDGGSISTGARLSEGAIELDVPPDARALRIEPAGSLPVSFPLSLPSAGDHLLPMIRFSRGACLEVRISDPDGAPIAGAWMETRPAGFFEWGRRLPADEDGLARLWGLRDDERVRILVRAPSRIPRGGKFAPGRIEMVLHPQAVLHGRVVDEEGLPVAYPEAIAYAPCDGPRSETRADHAYADAAGRFRLAVSPGRHRIVVLLPGASESEEAASRETDLVPGENPPVTLVVPR